MLNIFVETFSGSFIEWNVLFDHLYSVKSYFSLLVSLINLCWKLTLLNSNASEYDLFLQVKGPTDHSYFDSYPPEEEIPPDEMSGWDTDF